MAKLADNINALLAAAGVKLTDEQKTALSELPQEEVSASVQTFFDTAANLTTTGFANLNSKAGNLDKFDAGLEAWADLLGDDIKPIVKEKGPQKLEKIKAQIAKKIDEAKTAAAAGQPADLEKLKGEITTLQAKLQTAETDHAAALDKQKGEYEERIFKSKLMQLLQGRKDIAPSFNEPDALEMYVLPKLLKHLDSKGLKINPDKLDVVTKDTGVPYMKGAKAVTLEEAFGEGLEENKFRQNAGPTPPRSEFDTDGSDGAKVTRTSMLRPAVREV